MPYKHLNFHMYMVEPASQRFKRYGDNPILYLVFEYLSESNQIDAMIQSTKANRPAMEGVIEALEDNFAQCRDFDIESNYSHRQILGSMIRYIMGHYGYYTDRSKPLKKGSYIKTAIFYKSF